ncbi:MAG TPA: serine hydrolase domain-containing protein [Ilumatobacter sp.]|nr:serine hydrolase domain-containing protein [Ilumatobacter sp.]
MRRGLIALVLVLAACSGGDDAAGPVASDPPVTPTPTTEPVPPSTAAPTTTSAPAPNTTAPPATTAAPTATTAPTIKVDLAEVAAIIDGFVVERGLNGAGLVIVDAEDGIVGEYYTGEFGPDRVSFVASSSKMVTAGVLMHLADQGLLDPDQPIAEYVSWAAGHNTGITVAQLLSNSSGLVGLGPDPTYPPYLCQFLPDRELEECAAQIWTTDGDDADIVSPDTEYRYGGAQWQIAGAVAETVSGKSWAQLLDEVYVRPCGVESLGYNNHWSTLGGGGFGYPSGFDGDVSVLAPTDNPHMEGGLYIDPRDYAELLLMHLRGGVCGDTQVLSAEALAAMHADRTGTAYAGNTQTGSGYGLGWWVYPDQYRIDDPGAYGSYPWLDVGAGFGAYLVVEADAGLGAQLAGLLFEPVEAAVTTAR